MKNRWIILVVVVAMSFMACLDSSIVNIALPVIRNDMNVSLASVEWVVASYLIVICASLLLFGRMGDVYGKSKVFKWGTALFVIGSLLCGLCHSLSSLTIARMVQGIGASAYMANNQGIITGIFPKEERGKALGILGAAVALGNLAGPFAGGLILANLSWNYIFFVNVPIGMAAFVFEVKLLKNGMGKNENIDIVGTLLVMSGTALLFYTIISGQNTGLVNLRSLGFIAAAIVIIMSFVIYENKHEQPLLDIDIFRNSTFSLSLLCAFISFICIGASVIIIPFYLQYSLKAGTAKAGMFMMISPVIVALLSPVSGILTDKIGAELITIVGLILLSLSFFLMSFLGVGSTFLITGLFLAVMALGQGVFQPANNTLIMSAAPKSKLGIAGSVNSLIRNLGQIAGITLSTTLLYSFMSLKLGRHVADYVKGRDDVFIYGMNHVYAVLSGICLIGAVLTVIRYLRAAKNTSFEKQVS